MSRMYKGTKKSKLNPELMAALFSPTKDKPSLKRPQEFMKELSRYGLSYRLSDSIGIPRVELYGSDAEGLKKYRALLAANPEIEAWLILHEAVKNDNLLEAIKERASIQSEQGLSDSLYQTVLRRLRGTNEQIERDVNDKLKSPTNWEAELEKYRR